eukprot:scaffold3627_cov124-Isochrysis_galbana.AAC.10
MHRKHLQRYMPQLGELDAYKEVRGSGAGRGGSAGGANRASHVSQSPPACPHTQTHPPSPQIDHGAAQPRRCLPPL